MTTRAGDAAWSAREIAHTADVGFEVDGPTWPVLLERAALVVAAMIVSLDGVAPRDTLELAVAAGEPLDPRRHRVRGEVKGVTWHGLAVEETPAGLRARVILDV